MNQTIALIAIIAIVGIVFLSIYSPEQEVPQERILLQKADPFNQPPLEDNQAGQAYLWSD